MSFILATKLGMSRVFDAQGKAIPVTALKIDACYVTQRKTVEKDGYSAIQIGTGVARHPKKPQAGHTKTLSGTPQTLREVHVDEAAEFEVGQSLDLNQFEIGNLVKLIAVSKGKGFAGVIKRHNFHRGPETHGSDHHRAPGSIGSMFPQHVVKGHRMPGHMGTDQVTVRKVAIVDILAEEGVLLVKGPVPGTPGGLVEVIGMN